MITNQIKATLDQALNEFNSPAFIPNDPISIPHSFTRKQDIEISGFFASILAWGLRKTIISKCKELMQLMDNSPHDFVLNHSDNDLQNLVNFKHRTFNSTDLLYFIHFLKKHYSQNNSLESAFKGSNVKERLIHFNTYFFDDDYAPQRTQKHIATPIRKSTCKRLNMFLRWMVRKDANGVDFGIWNSISPSELMCPLDVHVERIAREFGLLERKQRDWLAVEELTSNLRKLDPEDPVKYDFALFGIGVNRKAAGS